MGKDTFTSSLKTDFRFSRTYYQVKRSLTQEYSLLNPTNESGQYDQE